MLATITALMQVGVAADTIEPKQTQEFSPLSTPMMVPSGTPVAPASSWTDIQAAIASAVGSIDIHVMNDISADSGAIIIPSGLSVYLRSNPASPNTYLIDQDNFGERHFVVGGGELSIGDIQLTRNTLPSSGFPSGGIQVTNNGHLKLFAGSLINNNEAEFGGGISVENATFEMQGGIISSNEAISSNGGGVYLSASTFIMSDGEIRDNTSFEMGGGVCITNNSTFTMQGGTITNNKTTTCSGGGIAVSESSFVMSGGTISDNTAVSLHGGGIFNTAGGSVNILGGAITNNATLHMHGGGIYNDEGSSLNISDGLIINNAAPNGFGGGIFTFLYDDLTIGPNTIFIGNTASSPHDWYLSPSFPGTPIGNVPSGESGWALGGSIASIEWYSTSIAGAHLLNNYDINFSGASITYQVVSFNPNGGSFADTVLSHIQADGQLQWRWISQVADTGVEDPPPTYSLAFDAAGNLRNLSLPHPTRTNYTFGGWFDSETNANGTTQEGRVLDTDAVTSDVSRTLYARWIRNAVYTVTFDLNGGNVNGNTANITYTVNQGEAVGTARVPEPTRTNYTFEGWRYIGQAENTPNWSCEDVTDWVVTESRTFVAQWIPTTTEPPTPEPPSTETLETEPPPKEKPKETPRNPSMNGPQTGDDTNLLLWNVLVLLSAVVALLSGGGLINTSAIGKKKEKRSRSSYSPPY